MTQLLVTGATMPVGRRLITQILATTEHRVLAVAAEPPEQVDLPARSDRLEYYQVDLTQPRAAHQLLFGPARQRSVEVLIHAAFHRDPERLGGNAHALDVEATRLLLDLAERHPTIQRFIYRSSSNVYRVSGDQPTLIGEDHPLRFEKAMSQSLRDRVEADLTVCSRMGLSPRLHTVVLRCAEILAPDSGSQLYDYLQSRVCLRPLGYDPLVQLLHIDDAADAMQRAITSPREGVFNIPGADTLPLSEVIAKAGRLGVSVPEQLLTPLYWLRRKTRHGSFRYSLNRNRFHFSGVLDGRRAHEELGYLPTHRTDWNTVPHETSTSTATGRWSEIR